MEWERVDDSDDVTSERDFATAEYQIKADLLRNLGEHIDSHDDIVEYILSVGPISGGVMVDSGALVACCPK